MKDYKGVVSLAYKEIFQDYEQIDIKNLLANIPSKTALITICHFLGQMHTQEKKESLQVEYIKKWFGRFPEDIQRQIISVASNKSGKKSEFNFINNLSALLLIERILENFNELSEVDDFTPEQELDLFKAYTWCTQEWIDKQYSVFNKIDAKKEEGLIALIMCMQAPQIDLIEFKDFRLQFIKAIYFFRFCEKDAVFSDYLKTFLKEFNFNTWQEYLKNLIHVYVRKLTPPNIPTLLIVKDENLDEVNWLDKLCINIHEFERTIDFKYIREKPVIRLDKNRYLFLNLNFFIDKLYQGIQFDFAQALINNGSTYSGNVFKNFPDFKQVYGEIYSESGLFYEVMQYVFASQKYLKIPGDKIHQEIGDGAPDYYMRDNTKVYLFEYKDVLIKAEVKHAYDYDIYKTEVFKKLVDNERGKAKGVTQLVNSIEKIITGKYNSIDAIDYSKLIIYPILVFTDHSFSLPGLNYILNKEFFRQLEDKGLMNKITIKKLTLINIDSLIKFQDLFRDKKITINHLINGYIEYTRSFNIFQKITTFDQYIHIRTSSMDYDSPMMLKEEAIKLLELRKE